MVSAQNLILVIAGGYCLMVFIYLVRICDAVEKTAKIAEEEQIARAEHRKKTAQDRERDRNERRLSVALKIRRSIEAGLKELGISLVGQGSWQEGDDRYLFEEILGGHKNRFKSLYLKIHPVSSLVYVDADDNDAVFSYPEDREKIVERLRQIYDGANTSQ